MTRICSVFGVIALVAICNSASAACGGGGYKVVKEDPRYDNKNNVKSNKNLSETKRDDSNVTVIRSSQIPASGQIAAQNVAYRSDVHLYDKAHVDGVRNRMDLTSNQDAVLEKVSVDFRKKGEDLTADFDDAKKKLDACKGECANERRNLEEVKAKLSKLDQEYERKIGRFLSIDQLSTFRSTSVSSNQNFK